MSLPRRLAAVAALALATVALPAAASTTIDFSSLPGGLWLNFGGYVEAGYRFDLVTEPNNSPHIGDGTYNPGTLNWHDDGANGPGAYIRMTRVDGAAFDLLAFDRFDYASFAVSAAGHQLNLGAGGSTEAVQWLGLTSVNFYASMYGGEIDNLLVGVSAVPEPETATLSLAGLLALGLTARRRRAA